MRNISAQIWISSRLTIERREDEESRALSFNLSGPFTARDMYFAISPDTFHKIFESPLGSGDPQIQHIDLSGVPYMDSSALDMLVSHYFRCRSRGIRVVVSSVSSRVLERFRTSNFEYLFQSGRRA